MMTGMTTTILPSKVPTEVAIRLEDGNPGNSSSHVWKVTNMHAKKQLAYDDANEIVRNL